MQNFRTLKKSMLILSIAAASMQANAQMTTSSSTTSSGGTDFPAKKADKWSVGIHLGNGAVTGDVKSLLPGLAGGINLRKSFGHVFSARFQGFYTQMRGLDVRAYSQINYLNPALNGSNNPNVNYNGKNFNYNYQTNLWEASIQGVFNTNNLNFYKRKPRWSLYGFAGFGIMQFSTKINAANGTQQYVFADNLYKGSDGKFLKNSEIRKNVKNIFDDSYETWGDGFSNTKKWQTEGIVTAGFGMQYRLNDRFELGLEQKISKTANDLLDGRQFRTVGSSSSVTTDFDSYSFTSLSLGFRLGKDDESRWWTNPQAYTYDQLAENTKKVKDATTDSDGDGVADVFDQEPNTPKGATVNARGVTLDSDKDGVPDYMDDEPFSEPGAKVNDKGVSLENDPNSPNYKNKGGDGGFNQGLANMGATGFNPCAKRKLPSVNFDLDRYYIKPEFYAVLHQIAMIMMDCPDIKMVCVGNTDVRETDAYNAVLSWKRVNKCVDYITEKYGISRSRFILNYDGEKTPLIKGLPDNSWAPKYEVAQYKNRRVDFRIAEKGEAGDSNPPMPKGPKNAGRDF